VRRQPVDKGEQHMEIKRRVSSENGSAKNFTGPVQIDRVFPASPAGGADWRVVTFETRARTAWHTHPKGQILIVTAGSGRVQSEGGPIEEIRPGDVVSISPGEKHWHGASPTAAMTHVAINEAPTNWMEKVSDEQYET
jgi:quercetin dioxygenase-like cupin family protein